MKNFAKSILNYFATFNETRFRFSKKVSYAWTGDTFTLNLSVFPQFESALLDAVSANASDVAYTYEICKLTLDGRRGTPSLSHWVLGIDLDCIREGVTLEDLIVAAHTDAKTKMDSQLQDKMKDLTGGLPIPFLSMRGGPARCRRPRGVFGCARGRQLGGRP